MEFPAVSQSRKEFWSAPQYTRNGMLLFTVIFGFFGLHHLLLRSPQTGLLMLLANTALMGYPWLYDVIQLLPESWGGHGTENLNKYGMGHAFGALGLGQGMWLPDDYKAPDKEPPDAPPSPWWFFFFVLALPFTFMAPLLGGDHWGAIAKLGYNFIFFGWIMGMCAFVYDLFYVLLKPADLFAFGLKRFFPWTIFMDKDGHSPSITGVRPPVPDPCPPQDGFFIGLLKFLSIDLFKFVISISLPVLKIVNPPLAMSLEPVLQSASGAGAIGNAALAVAGAAKNIGTATIQVADTATDVAVETIEDTGKVIKSVGKLAGNIDAATHKGLNATPTLPAAALKQLGGGQSSSFSALDYAAAGTIAAVIGGAFLLSAGRSYGGLSQDKGDSPPNA